MTTREYFRFLRADLFRADVHAFVLVERIADHIVRCLPMGKDLEAVFSVTHSRGAARAYKDLLELCDVAVGVRHDVAGRDPWPGEIAALYEMRARWVVLPTSTTHQPPALTFHPKAFEMVFAPLSEQARADDFDVLMGVSRDQDPVAHLFGPGRWLR